MSERRQVWATLSRLLLRLENALPGQAAAGGRPDLGEAHHLTSLEQEIRKLGKAQFKANLLAEEHAARLDKALSLAQAAQVEQAQSLQALQNIQPQNAQRDLLEAILPALDGLEQAISSGQRYLQVRDLAANKVGVTPEQAKLISPADRAVLAGWLDGLRLVRERLLSILTAGNVTVIPTIGQPFDPFLHVAVGVARQAPPGTLPGTIIAEERPGYRSPAGVIRFAEVVVYQPG